MIKKLQAQNLNGRTFGYDLAPLTIFTGDNTAGKSTIGDAIKLATLGSVPGYSATNTEIVKNFSTGVSLAVAIETAKGSFARSWTRNGKKIVADTSGDEAVALALAPALLNGEAFFAAKPAARANMIRAAFPADGDPKQAVRDAVAAAGGIADSKKIKDLAFDEWVQQYLEELAEEAKVHRANVKRMTGVVQGLEQLSGDDHVAKVKKEDLVVAQEAVTKAAQALGSAEQAVRAIVIPAEAIAPKATREEIKTSLAKLTEIVASKDASLRSGSELYNAARREFEAEFERYENNLSRHTEATLELEEAVKAGIEYAIDKNNAAEFVEATKGSARSRDELKEKARLTKEIHVAMMGKLDTAQAELDTLSANIGDGCSCATCGAAKEYWKADFLKLASERVELASRKRDDAMEKRNESNAAASEAAAELDKVLAIMDKREKALAIVEAFQILAENPTPGEFTRQAPAEFDAEKLQEELYNLNCEISELRDDLQAWDDAEAFASKKAERLAAEQALSAAQAAHETAKQALALLQAAFDKGSAAEASKKKAEEAGIELDAANKALKENEATADIVTETARKESEKALAPMLKVANQFTAGILSPPLSNVGFDLGRWHGTQWQPIARLSGAEKAMFVAALDAALATEGSKVVLIDEFSVIDDKWKPMFLNNLREAYVSGQIEQAIILDNREIQSDGWTNIRLK